MFSEQALKLAEELAYANEEIELSDADAESIGFEHEGMWIVNPFVDSTGRFPFSLNGAYKTYGKDNVDAFITDILKQAEQVANNQKERRKEEEYET